MDYRQALPDGRANAPLRDSTSRSNYPTTKFLHVSAHCRAIVINKSRLQLAEPAALFLITFGS
jgi:hypothetical protein